MFKITGVAEATANLLWEFKIAEKKEDRLTKNKNGKVILVKVIASSILSGSMVKPGAIKLTNRGIKSSIIKTKKNKTSLDDLPIYHCFFIPHFTYDIIVMRNNN